MESIPSRFGRDAIALTPAASITSPSTIPALTVTTSFSVDLMNCSITRAGATASSLEVANAVGPSKCSAKPSRFNSFAAIRVKVFLITLYSTPSANILRRRSVACATVKPE